VDDDTIVAIVAAVVASIAMLITLRQAREAEKTRKATEAQAVEAQRSAEAAEQSAEFARRSAEAAERDAAINERLEAAQLAEKDELEGPDFKVEWTPMMGDSDVVVDVRMSSGPELEMVTFTAVGLGVRGVSSPDGVVTAAPALEWDHVSPPDSKRVRIDMGNLNESVHVVLRLRCIEMYGRRREWTREYPIDDPD
jgi:hypothetical protein